MITIDPLVQIFVRDQDEALTFYTGKLGMEVRMDHQTPDFRWLMVGMGGEDSVSIVLAAQQPDKPIGGMLYLSTADFAADFEALKQRGVEFAGEPDEQPYGVSVGLLDPSGNYIKLASGK